MVQALIYLVTNAVEAIADAAGRHIKVVAEDAGHAVEFVVWDSGGGVPEPLRESVFEPFFTTKDEDHLGLGLALARRVARLHDGGLCYEPERGFVMRLPKNNGAAQ